MSSITSLMTGLSFRALWLALYSIRSGSESEITSFTELCRGINEAMETKRVLKSLRDHGSIKELHEMHAPSKTRYLHMLGHSDCLSPVNLTGLVGIIQDIQFSF